MRFLKLTQENGRPVWVNANMIVQMFRNPDNVTEITCSVRLPFAYVTETPGEIVAMLAER